MKVSRSLPPRRALQICLALFWLLDAALQFQPYMFGPFFVTQVIQLSSAGSPGVVAGSVGWATHLMLQHIAVYNTVFASAQLMIACGILVRRTLKIALVASIGWALLVWWFGESLGGIFAGASALTGFPGGVVLYAFASILLWPRDRASSVPAASSPLGPVGAGILWFALWGSLSWTLWLPANRSPDAVAQVFAITDGQPGWVVSLMNWLAALTSQHGTQICLFLSIACGLVAIAVPAGLGLTGAAGIAAGRAWKPALVLAIVLSAFIWLAEGFGGIFTGQGTDPNTGPLLILLAACYWPARARRDARAEPASLAPARVAAGS